MANDENSSDIMKKITAVGGVVGILASGAALFDYLGITPQKDPVQVVVVTEANPETDAPVPETPQQAAVSTAEMQTEPDAAETSAETVPGTEPETETKPETETAPPETVPVQDEIKADSTFHVTNLAAIAQPPSPYNQGWEEYSYYHIWQNVSFFDYDPFSDTLYYMPTPYTIKSHSMRTGEEKLLADISSPNPDAVKIKLIAVNPQTGTLYAVIGGAFYDVTHDAWAAGDDTTQYYFPSESDYENVYFSGEDTIAEINTASHHVSTISLSAKEFIQRDIPLTQLTPDDFWSDSVYAFPFLSQDCYYWILAARERQKADVVKSVQMMPSQPETSYSLPNCENIMTFCTRRNALYYYDAQKNIYQFDTSAEHSNSALMANAPNSDILLVRGSNIENTASNYLSEKVSRFIKISNSRFIFYDMSDNMLKLIEAD